MSSSLFGKNFPDQILNHTTLEMNIIEGTWMSKLSQTKPMLSAAL